MIGVFFQGETYNDDRMFVLHICKCKVTDDDDTVTTTIYHESPPDDSKWCLVTYRNTVRYPAFRVDPYDSFDEVQACMHSLEPTVPRISLGGSSPKIPLSYEEFAMWKAKNGLKDYDYKVLYTPGGTNAREMVLSKKQPDRPMKWPLMTKEEVHAFGIELILPYLEKEGVTIESVNPDIQRNPQIVGKRWDKPAFIVVRTACYPSKGELSSEEHRRILDWADKQGATAFFASVGIACVSYPDKSAITADEHMGLPIRSAGFHIAYPGLVIITTSDRVRLASDPE